MADCHRRLFGSGCTCAADLVLEVYGESYRIDMLGNLVNVSEH